MMVKKNNLGIVGRLCLLGSLGVGAIAGCIPTEQQRGSINQLIQVTRQGYYEMERNDAIRDSGTQVNVNVGGERNGKVYDDIIIFKNGFIREDCIIYGELGDYLIFETPDSQFKTLKNRIQSYKIR